MRLYYRSKGYADASVPPPTPNTIPRSKGFDADVLDRGRPALSFRRYRRGLQRAGAGSRKAAPPDAGAGPAPCSTATRSTRPPRCSRPNWPNSAIPLRRPCPRTTRDAVASASTSRSRSIRARATYVERIDIHGNTRTRDYVIRREFDIAEGDAYNKTLIDRAERRLKNLNYFKTVKISTQPGSTPDRVVLDVELVEQATGDFTSPAAIRPPTAGSPRSRRATAISSAAVRT